MMAGGSGHCATDSDPPLGAPRYCSLAPRAAPSPAPPRAPPPTLLARAARTGEEGQCVNCSQCSTTLLARKVFCGSCHTSRAEHLSFGVVVSVEVRPYVFTLADCLRAAIEKAKEPGLVRTKWVHMSLGTFKALQTHLHSARTPDGRADREHIQGWTQTAGVRGGKNVNHEWTMNVLSHEATAAFLQRSYSEQRSSLLFSQELISVSKEWTVKGPVVSSISLLCRQMGPVSSFNPVLPTVRVRCSTFSLSSEAALKVRC